MESLLPWLAWCYQGAGVPRAPGRLLPASRDELETEQEAHPAQCHGTGGFPKLRYIPYSRDQPGAAGGHWGLFQSPRRQQGAAGPPSPWQLPRARRSRFCLAAGRFHGKGSAREGIRNGLQHAAVSWLTKRFQDPAAEQARTHGHACRGRTDTRLGMPCRHRARRHLPLPATSFSPSQPAEPPAPVSPQLFPPLHPSILLSVSVCVVCVCVSVSEGWAPRLSPQDPGAPGAEGCFSFPLAGIQLLSLVFPFSFSPGIRPL